MLQVENEIQLPAPVWRMEIDEATDVICVEIRDPLNKSVSFSSIDLNSGEQYIKALTMPHGWQCGLDAATSGVMLIHSYQSEALPIRKGLTAIDEKTGNALWENYNYNLESINSVGIEVYDVRLKPKRILLINSYTGVAIIPRVENGFPASSVIYPKTLDKNLAGEFNLGNGVQGDVLFLDCNGYRILSLHALSEGAVTQHLYVYDTDSNIIFEDIIARDIQKLQPEAFIVYKNKLIWLQNRSVLKVLQL